MGRYKQPFTIFKRGKYFYYRTYDARGVRTVAKSTGQTNKTAALNYCNELFKLDKLLNRNKTFREYANGFFDDKSAYMVGRGLTKGTQDNYNSILYFNIMPYFEKMELSSITPTVIKKYRVELCEKYSNATVNVIITVLGIILTAAYLDNLYLRNPMESIEPLKVEKQRRGCLNREDIKKMISAAAPRYKPLFIMLACTGLRVNECLALSNGSLKSENGVDYLYVDKQKYRGVYTPTKTKQARCVPICPELKQYVNCFEYDYRSVQYNMKRFFEPVKDYKERKLSIHSFRHFFITDAKSCGINTSKVETIAGHSLKGIEQVYTNYNVMQLAEIIAWQKELLKEIL